MLKATEAAIASLPPDTEDAPELLREMRHAREVERDWIRVQLKATKPIEVRLPQLLRAIKRAEGELATADAAVVAAKQDLIEAQQRRMSKSQALALLRRDLVQVRTSLASVPVNPPDDRSSGLDTLDGLSPEPEAAPFFDLSTPPDEEMVDEEAYRRELEKAMAAAEGGTDSIPGFREAPDPQAATPPAAAEEVQPPGPGFPEPPPWAYGASTRRRRMKSAPYESPPAPEAQEGPQILGA